MLNLMQRLGKKGAIPDNLDSSKNQSFWYTASNRLQNASGLWGSSTYYYDGVGNRTYDIETADGSTSVYGYPYNSNLVVNITQGSTTIRSFAYDGAGNITSDNRDGTTYNYLYNNRDRLAELDVGSTVTADYAYDGLERLAIRITANMTPSGTTQYVYDLAGHLLAESDGSGDTLTEYVWLDDMPLALVANVDTGPTLYFVHVDHLNRPIMMTDVNKNVAWQANYNPFGDVYSTTGLATNNLRFPGQYFLIEDGLHYNWYRYYDPTLGRYTQPDPLGSAMVMAAAIVPRGASSIVPMPNLASADPTNYPDQDIGGGLPEFNDGPSIYAYAQSSPIMETDPKGLASGPFTPAPSSSNQLCYVIPVCTLVPSMVQIMRPQNMTSCYYSCFGGGTKSFIIEGIGGCPGIVRPD